MKTKFFFSIILFLTAACATHPKPLTSEEQAFFYSVGQGQEANVIEKLNQGVSPNLKNPAGITPLMLAAFRGHQELVRELISRGAQLESREAHQRTALYFAIEGGQPDTVQLLLASGAQVNIHDDANLTPLMVAASKAQAPATALLLAAKADVHAMDENLWTALFYSVLPGPADVPLELIRAGSDINHLDADGDSLAHLCADRGNLKLLKILAAQGLNLSLKDKAGLTAKDLASKRLDFEIVDYLERK